MSILLLRTKLYPPAARPDLVVRPHLIRQLDEGLRRGHRLTLISAPAGFGKTTLLGTWLSHLGTAGKGGAPPTRVSWLSLDEGDNDPVRFVTYVLAALQPSGEAPDLGALHASQPPSWPVAALLAASINRIDAVEEGTVLVLDDYHTLTSPAVHQAVAYLLDHQPRNLHLVIATRLDPPLPIARLRGRGQLTELRQADLGFSAGEVEDYLGQVMGLALSPGEVAALAARTEGWITGLQMAALAMQKRDAAGIADFVAAFTGRHEHVVDYFGDEVLAGQPDRVQAFLLQTSILERLSGPLCDAVCDAGPGESSQQILERLQGANLFVVPLDDERCWYRYHRLFADLLRQRLGQLQPHQVPILHRRASAWYEQQGLAGEAIEHAQRGGDPARAARLMEQAAEVVLLRGELVTLAAWVQALPDEIVRQRPLLCFHYAAALLLRGEPPARIQEYLQIATEGDVPQAVAQGTVALRALLALWQGDLARSVDLGRQALASWPEQDPLWRGIITGNLGIAYTYAGRELDLAGRMLADAARLGERAGNVMGAVVALCNLAELRMVQGRLRAALGLYERALALAVDDGGRDLPIRGMAVIGLAGLHYEWNELAEAECLLTTAVDLADEQVPFWAQALDGYLLLAWVKQSQGEERAAREAMARAEQAAARTDATEVDDWIVEVHRARLWIAQGQLDAAARWARDRGLVDRPAAEPPEVGRSSQPYSAYELERLTLAELWLVQGEAGHALALLAALLDRARALQRMDSAIKVRVLTALAHQQQNRPDQALSALAEALAQAEAEGYVRTFVDHGPPMARLLRQALARGIATAYVQRLLAACDPGTVPPAGSQSLVESLSERELQVLRLLATHLTSAEIGETLFISANTVRFHTKNIYGKLGVHSRGAAVQQARELGLL